MSLGDIARDAYLQVGDKFIVNCANGCKGHPKGSVLEIIKTEFAYGHLYIVCGPEPIIDCSDGGFRGLIADGRFTYIPKGKEMPK